MSAQPLPNGGNGRPQRDTRGRFVCFAGPGNPNGKAVAELRSAMLRAVKAGDVEAIIAKMIEAAKNGDTVAAREVLDRTIGKPSQTDVLQRLEALEHLFSESIP